MRSPFSPVLDQAETDLPAAFRDQFLLSPDDGWRVILVGRMDRVWRRLRLTWPIFWILARFDILFPETGREVPATMVVEANRAADGSPTHMWRRTFSFPTQRFFNATMAYDSELGRVVEYVGPGNRIQIVWDIAFLPPGTIQIRTVEVNLRLLRRSRTLPSWLRPIVVATEHASPVRDREIHVELSVSHVSVGSIFGYEGTFHVSRDGGTIGES